MSTRPYVHKTLAFWAPYPKILFSCSNINQVFVGMILLLSLELQTSHIKNNFWTEILSRVGIGLTFTGVDVKYPCFLMLWCIIQYHLCSNWAWELGTYALDVNLKYFCSLMRWWVGNKHVKPKKHTGKDRPTHLPSSVGETTVLL